MSNSEIVLTGLDGTNPLAFLASLGVLDVVDRCLRNEGKAVPALRWEDRGRWVPVLDSQRCLSDLLTLVVDDARSWSNEPVLELTYDANGALCSDQSRKCKRDLKPAPRAFREFLESLMRGHFSERSLRLAGSFGSELAVDGKGNIKPTALHFSAGQQEFLKMAIELRDSVNKSDFEEALLGPWRGESKLPSFSWDSGSARLYALRATDPSAEKRGSVAAANWLGLLGLRFLPVAVRGTKLQTTCVRGGWKDAKFTWPLWSANANARTVAALLRFTDFSQFGVSERQALGIEAVYRCNIGRSDQGGYGSFYPATVV